MSINEMERKVREMRELQTLIEEATAEVEALKDAIKAARHVFSARNIPQPRRCAINWVVFFLCKSLPEKLLAIYTKNF